MSCTWLGPGTSSLNRPGDLRGRPVDALQNRHQRVTGWSSLLLTLLAVPVAYSLLDDAAAWLARRLSSRAKVDRGESETDDEPPNATGSSEHGGASRITAEGCARTATPARPAEASS